MKTFKVGIITAVIALFSSEAMARPGITLSCQTLNFDTQVPQTAFHPGDKVLIVVTYSFPTGAAGVRPGEAITLTANATASFAGIQLPFTLNPVIGRGPNTDPTTGTALFVSGSSQRAVLKISRRIPVGTMATVFLTASAPGLAAGRCSAQVTVF
jgi:hypothetical protein